MIVDKSKKYQTLSGKPVRIYATDGGGAFPVHGAVLNGDTWHMESWRDNGINLAINVESKDDLVEVAEGGES